MRKRGATIKHRDAVAPTLVKLSFGEGVDFSVMTYTSIDGLISGWADDSHLLHLHDLANTVILVGSHKGNNNAIAAGRACRDVVKSAVARKKTHGKYGINGDELKTLRDFAKFVMDFYPKTSGAAVTKAELKVARIKEQTCQS